LWHRDSCANKKWQKQKVKGKGPTPNQNTNGRPIKRGKGEERVSVWEKKKRASLKEVVFRSPEEGRNGGSNGGQKRSSRGEERTGKKGAAGLTDIH